MSDFLYLILRGIFIHTTVHSIIKAYQEIEKK